MRVAESGWVAKGLTEVVSGPIDLLNCPARPVGSDGWYLARPGFAWGGIGVAACWFGGAVGVGYCLGPAPLAMDKHHARRVADLELYLRQHHAERDEAALRRQVLRQPEWP